MYHTDEYEVQKLSGEALLNLVRNFAAEELFQSLWQNDNGQQIREVLPQRYIGLFGTYIPLPSRLLHCPSSTINSARIIDHRMHFNDDLQQAVTDKDTVDRKPWRQNRKAGIGKREL